MERRKGAKGSEGEHFPPFLPTWRHRKRVGETWGRRIVPMIGLVGGSVFIAVGARTIDAVVGGPLWLGITPGKGPT